ncbi:MAG: hypothetical protein ACI9FD_002166 [Gammaproteobacteria bacterium]
MIYNPSVTFSRKHCSRQRRTRGFGFWRRALLFSSFLVETIGVSKMKAKQLSARGGIIHCEFDKDRVRLAGSAEIFHEGQIFV